QVGFRLVEQDERGWRVERDLACQLAADGSRSAGNQDRLAVQIGRQFRQLELDWLTAEQVLDPDLTELLEPDVTCQHLANAGQDLEWKPGGLALGDDTAQVIRRG